MRDRAKTIAGLRAMAERPGSPNEGEIAKRLLAQLGVKPWNPRVFNPSVFPRGTVIFYCYWCYGNDRGVIACDAPKSERGQWWMRIKFDRLKQARWVPVTSLLGCHIDVFPFTGNEAETLYRMDLEWEEKERQLIEKLRKSGIPAERLEMVRTRVQNLELKRRILDGESDTQRASPKDDNDLRCFTEAADFLSR